MVLRGLAAVFLSVAVVDTVVAVQEAAWWPMAAALACTAFALCLERLVHRSRATDPGPKGATIPRPRQHDSSDHPVPRTMILPGRERK